MKYILLSLILVSSISYAQIIKTTPPFPTEGSEAVPVLVKPKNSPAETAVEKIKPLPEVKKTEIEEKKSRTSKDARADSTGTVMLGYQLITSWLPSKKTISYTHIFNEKWSLEGEYSFQSIDSPLIGVDVGEITERRFTLQARRYVGNSFHFSFGPLYSTFKARLGSDILDDLAQEIGSEFSAHNLGITGGVGNRWQWDNGFTVGIDWLRLNVPVLETKIEDKVLDDISGSEDRDDVKTFIRAFNRIPTFVLFGVNIGYTF